MATVSTLLVYVIGRSRMGLALRAIREDEISAAVHGVNVLKYKVLAFSIGAFLAGVAGSMCAYYLFDLKPDSMYSLNWGLYPILICVLGGAGTVIGPVARRVHREPRWSPTGTCYFPGSQTILSGLLIIRGDARSCRRASGARGQGAGLWHRTAGARGGRETAE